MAMILPEIVLQRVIQQGIKDLRARPAAFKEIFDQLASPELVDNYGQSHIDGIRTWFQQTKLPVNQAHAFDPTVLPSISIHLGVENEDESKASMGDLADFDDAGEVLGGTDNVVLDIGIHADRSKDDVLWLYYIIKYIMYKNKPLARKLGLQLHTFSVSEYSKQAQSMPENIWTRYIRFRCTVQNFIDGTVYSPDIEEAQVQLLAQPTDEDGDNDIIQVTIGYEDDDDNSI